MASLAVDTSVAVAHLLESHTHHDMVRRHLAGSRPHLTTHSLAETYSVLTRLPGDARLSAPDASRLIETNFPDVADLPTDVARRLHVVLSNHGIGGGAVYDALSALAALHNDLPLATRDGRAASTYLTLGAQVELIVA